MATTLNERVAKYHGTAKGRLTHLLCGARTRSKKANVPFDIDGKYLLGLYNEQGGVCPFTKRAFDLSTRKGRTVMSPDAMSIDRLNSQLGYVEGNVRIISIIANVCRGRWSDEVLFDFCKDVTENK